MDGPRGRNWRTKFFMHILITLCFVLCLMFNSEKLPLVDFKSRISGIVLTDEAYHVGTFSKLTTAGLVMWPLFFVADRLMKMVGEGKVGGSLREATLAGSAGVDASKAVPVRSHFVDVRFICFAFIVFLLAEFLNVDVDDTDDSNWLMV